MPPKLRTAFGLLLAVLLLTPGVSAAQRDTLTVGVRQFPPNFHPAIQTTVAKFYVLGMARRPISAFDHQWKLVCFVCVELPTIENGLARETTASDGNRAVDVTFELHPDAKWADGTPVTSNDVRFSWEVGKHPQSGAETSAFYRNILDVEILGPKKFTLHLKKLSFDYNDISRLHLLPEHLERPIFEGSPESYRQNSLFEKDATNPGLYFGPYRISGISRGTRIVLEQNPFWWGPPPHFKQVVIQTIENTASLEASLLSGDIDMIAGEVGLSTEQVVRLEERFPDRFQYIYKSETLFEHIDINQSNPILADLRVRQALMYATDRSAITNSLFAGKVSIANSHVSPLDWTYTPDVPKYPFDPAKAKGLLENAGWEPGAEGIRVNSAGEPLRLEINSTTGHITRENVEQVLKSQWRQVGIDLRIRNQPPRVLFGRTLAKRLFPAMILYAYNTPPEWVPRGVLHSNNIPSDANGWSGYNFTGFQNPEVDRLIEAIEVELDTAKREKMWHRLQEIYAEKLPSLPLFFYSLGYVLPKWLQGVRPTGHSSPTTYWIEYWRVGSQRN